MRQGLAMGIRTWGTLLPVGLAALAQACASDVTTGPDLVGVPVITYRAPGAACNRLDRVGRGPVPDLEVGASRARVIGGRRPGHRPERAGSGTASRSFPRQVVPGLEASIQSLFRSFGSWL